MIAYPVPGKQKSADICEAFIRGAGIEGARSDAAVFYGIVESNWKDWERVKSSGRDYYIIDNSYFDVSRKTHLRVTKNRLQHSGLGESDCERFSELGIEIKPWQKDGEHIVVCKQSQPFMKLVGFDTVWFNSLPDRKLKIRDWRADKAVQSVTLLEDLKDAWALVTYSSAAAITAVLEGIPVFSIGKESAAWEMSGKSLFNDPVRAFPENRLQWASVLADNQWTKNEMRSGLCWEML